MGDNCGSPDIDRTGRLHGCGQRLDPYGDIYGAGPEADFHEPPTVVADANRHTLASATSTTHELDAEFFNTTTQPVGHGFTQANLDQDSACYSFVPKSDIPIKFIVLDDTVKGPGQANYAAGALDDTRYHGWSTNCEAGQAANQLMVIAAHVPIMPQNSLTDTTPFPMWPGPEYTDDYVLNMLHHYPNLILWMAGHRHVNVVTPQPDPAAIPPGLLGGGDLLAARPPAAVPHLRHSPQQRQHGVDHHHQRRSCGAAGDSPAYKSRGYAIGAARIYGTYPLSDTTRTPTTPSWWCS